MAMWGKETGLLFLPLVVAMDLMFPVKGDLLPWRRYASYSAVAGVWLLLRASALGSEPQPWAFIDNPIIGMSWFQSLLTAL